MQGWALGARRTKPWLSAQHGAPVPTEQELALRSKHAKVRRVTGFNLPCMEWLQLLLSAGEGPKPGPALPTCA